MASVRIMDDRRSFNQYFKDLLDDLCPSGDVVAVNNGPLIFNTVITWFMALLFRMIPMQVASAMPVVPEGCVPQPLPPQHPSRYIYICRSWRSGICQWASTCREAYACLKEMRRGSELASATRTSTFNADDRELDLMASILANVIKLHRRRRLQLELEDSMRELGTRMARMSAGLERTFSMLSALSDEEREAYHL